MTFLESWGKEVVALLVPVVTWILNVGIKSKAKLLWAKPHSFTFLIAEPQIVDGQKVADLQNVYTASYRLVNTGREAATNVQVVFNWKPRYVNVWPIRKYEESVDPDGRCTFTFSSFAPKEEGGFEVMSINAALPEIVSVRSDQCVAQVVGMRWTRWVPQWRITFVQFLCFLGLATLVYGFIVLVQLLVLRTVPI
ncbi:hypothetical protein EJO66_08920 [Variovorax beijingensis]|uniref:DUF3592 domain-containing protein n=1 Tax=Variovorax beijingensis TaxID=2496117 RepID=A0ABY0AB33_9BURK|nr:hypothetical protein [Variovorax beijingensis]RSZ40244.1 hypothetical protein EJO66_08920 [Variovorax beijingensis]